MKKHLLLIMISFLTLASCVKDETVHDFKELNSVAISGLEDAYIFNFLEEETLEPTVNVTMNDPSDLEYRWYLYNSKSRFEADTLSREKNMKALITAVPGEAYTLVFSVKETKSGLVHKKVMDAEVIGEFTRGTMFLTEENGKVDIKFLKPDNELKHDVFSTVNPGMSLSPEAHKIQFANPSNFHPGAKGIFIGSGTAEGGHVIDAVSLKSKNALSEQFYNDPNYPSYEFTNYFAGFLWEYMMVNGKLHDRKLDGEYLWRPNLIISDQTIATDYKLAPVFINERLMRFRGAIVFDNLHGRFLHHSPTNRATLNQFTGGSNTVFDYNNTGMRLLFAYESILPAEYSGQYYFAVTEDKNDPSKKYLLKFLYGRLVSGTPTAFHADALTELTADMYPGLQNATMFESDLSLQGILWYSDGQKLYALDTTTEGAAEIVVKDFSAEGLEADLMKFYTYEDEEGNDITELRVAVRDVAQNQAGMLYMEASTLGGINIQEKSRLFGLGERIIDFDEKLN